MTTIELDDRGLVMACPQCGQGNNPDKLHEDFSEEDQTGTAGHVPALRAAFFLAANCSRARELSLGVNQESRRVVAQKQ